MKPQCVTEFLLIKILRKKLIISVYIFAFFRNIHASISETALTINLRVSIDITAAFKDIIQVKASFFE